LCALITLTSYQLLVELFSEAEEYRLYYAQCLYKAGEYPQALENCQEIEGPGLIEKV
jgi:hypothetical protein